MLSGMPSLITNVPRRGPAAVGLKLTRIVQEPPAATLSPQSLVWEKSSLAVMLEIASGVLVELVSVIVCALLLAPRVRAGKVSADAENLAPGATVVTAVTGAAGERAGCEGRTGRPGPTLGTATPLPDDVGGFPGSPGSTVPGGKGRTG